VDLHVSEPRAPRTALVHDFLVSMRGADRVFLEICEMYPDADVFTPIYHEAGTEGRLAGRAVHTSFLQRLRPTSRTFRPLLPLYPAAIESFDLSGYDLVISSSSAWAHAVICDEDSVHLCYCHNPFRYAWNERRRAIEERHVPLVRAALTGLFRRWRMWDWQAAQRVDRYLTNSRTTQGRIQAYFGRESTVVHPPVDTARFRPQQPLGRGAQADRERRRAARSPIGRAPDQRISAEHRSHYVVLSELVSHKRIEDAVLAFNSLGRPLVVVGDGPEARRLRRLAAPNVRFVGRAADREVERLLATCRAFVLTSVEEFGIAAVEAQAAGRPVIARRAGGALETVIEGRTGRFYEGGARELAAAVEEFDDAAIDPSACVQNAARFDRARFREAFSAAVDELLDERSGERTDDVGRRRLRKSRARGLYGLPSRSAP